jgi:HPt (histidine-containing phosphotransfer) domain-containing protein
MSSPGFKVINLEFLMSFCNGDQQRLKRYISLFMDQAPAMIQSLRELHDSKSWDSLRLAAHTLKPQVAYMGMTATETNLGSIERMAEAQGDSESIKQLISAVETDCSTAFTELNEVLASN